MSRRYGRAQRGMRVHDAVPKNFGSNVTILGALSCTGLDAVMTVDGATDTAVFRAYVEQVLVPTLEPNDIVVMDNLSVHKVRGIREAIEAVGRGTIDLFAAILARLLPHRKLLVQAQDKPAKSKGAYPRNPRPGAQAGYGPHYRFGCQRLV